MDTSLYYFIIAAEEMNLSRAAERLYVSPQALSKHIKRIENEYNTVLFQRLPRLRLTIAGEHMLSYAKNIMDSEQHLLQLLHSPNAEETIKLPIGVSSAKGHIIMPAVFPRYKLIQPRVIPSIYEGTRKSMDVLMQNGKIDMYFRMSGSDVFYGNFQSFGTDDMLFVLSRKILERQFGDGWRDYLAEHADGVTAREVCRFPLIYPNEGSNVYHTISSYLIKYTPQRTAETNNYTTVFKIVQNGFSAGFQSKLFFCDMLSRTDYRDDMFGLRIKDIEGIADFGVVHGFNTKREEHIGDFIELARETTDFLDREANKYLEEQLRRIQALADKG